jgi:hypothetical protein
MSSYQLTEIREKCPICLETNDRLMVAHNKQHPIHIKCIKIWYRTGKHCPICREPCNLDEFITLKDRIWSILSIEDILNCMAFISFSSLFAETEFSLIGALFAVGLMGCIYRDTGELTIIKIGLIAAYFYYLRTHPMVYSGITLSSGVARYSFERAVISFRNTAREFQAMLEIQLNE